MKESTETKNVRYNKKVWMIIGLGILTIILGITMIMKMNSEMELNAKKGTIDGASTSEINHRLKKKVDASVLAVSINQRIIFKDSKSEGIFNLENLPENNYDITLEIYLKKENILVYQTKKIAPGYMVKRDKLLKELDKGVYLATAIFKGFDKEGNESNQVSAQIEITIEH